MSKIEQLETKVDLLFSVIANKFLAEQAIQVFQSIQDNMDTEDADKEALQEVLKKSMESYKHHSESVNDSVTYYYDLFGEESNKNMVSRLKDAGLDTNPDEQKEPEPLTSVKSSGSNTSERDD